MTNARVRFALFVVTLLMTALACATAERLEGVTVSVVITSATAVEERAERIVTESVLIALDRSEIEAVVVDFELTEDEPSRRDVARIATEGESNLVLICQYRPIPDSPSALEITFALYLFDQATPIATLEQQTEINLSLDISVGDYLEILLDAAYSYLRRSDPKALTEIMNANDDSSADADAAGGDSAEGDSGRLDSSAAGADGAQAGAETGELMPNAQQPIVNKTVEFSAGYAPSLAVGPASGYYQFAHGAGGSVHIVLGKRNGLGIGIAASAVFASVSGLAADGEMLIVPFAATVALRSNPEPFGAYISIGGGGALLRVINPVLGTLMKVVPYATVGMGMKIALLDWIGIDASINFDAIFEGSVLLTSVAPSISLYIGI